MSSELQLTAVITADELKSQLVEAARAKLAGRLTVTAAGPVTFLTDGTATMTLTVDPTIPAAGMGAATVHRPASRYPAARPAARMKASSLYPVVAGSLRIRAGGMTAREIALDTGNPVNHIHAHLNWGCKKGWYRFSGRFIGGHKLWVMGTTTPTGAGTAPPRGGQPTGVSKVIAALQSGPKTVDELHRITNIDKSRVRTILTRDNPVGYEFVRAGYAQTSGLQLWRVEVKTQQPTTPTDTASPTPTDETIGA